MLPVGEAGEEDAIEVGEDGTDGFGIAGRVGGKGGADLAGHSAGHDGAIGDGSAIVGDKVDDLVAGPAELFGCHRGKSLQ